MDSREELEIFPREDVEACMNDEKLQRGMETESPFLPTPEMETSRLGAIRAGAPDRIRWIYFESPPWTWERLCGRAGWLLVDPETLDQFDFSMTIMN